VTALEAVPDRPVPRALIAATLNRYVVPADRPVKIWVVAVELNVCVATGTKPTIAVIA
jgi:hypothetical protein